MMCRSLTVGLMSLLLHALPTSAQREREPVRDAPKKAELVQIEGQLTEADPKDKLLTESPHKVHVVKLLASKSYVIDLMRKNDQQKLDPFLRVEDAAGKQLASDDDGGEGLNSRIHFNPPRDGDYRIIATCLSGLGDYTLKIQEARPLDPKLLGKVHEVGKDGLMFKGQLGADDPPDRIFQKSRVKYFQVKMTQGKSYTIEYNSNVFDCLLRVEDEKGKVLAFDDDGGGDLNSKIVFQAPQNAVFRIIATALDGRLGDFTLRVREN